MESSLIKPSISLLKIIQSKFTNYKVKQVLDDLAKGHKNIEEACKDNSELFRFTTYIESLNKSATYEKANLLTSLYMSMDNDDNLLDDVFFEIFSILGELSDREIRLLYLLEYYYRIDLKNKKSVPEFSEYFKDIEEAGYSGGASSDSFYYFVSSRLNINPDIISGLMKRLERSGLIQISGLDASARYQEYIHTALYNQIKYRIILALESSYSDSLKLTADVI